MYDPKTRQTRIIDFNVSKKTKKRKLSLEMMTPTGTLSYRAPETFKGSIYNANIDEWALGLTLYKMIA